MRIGILGGTFDPPHIAHLALARAALEQLELDELIFMPAARNPLKHKPFTTAKQRMEMVTRLIEAESKMAVSNLEVSKGGRSYAVDTMEELQAAQPADYWFIVGADVLRDMDQWKQPQRLLKLCRLGVAVRPPQTETQVLAHLRSDIRERVDIIKMPPMEVASFDIRGRIFKGQPVAPTVPDRVLDYIRENNLYRS